MRRWMLAATTFMAFGFGLSAAQPPTPIGPPTPVTPKAADAKPATEPPGTPVVIIPESEMPAVRSSGCSTCGPQTKIGQKINAHFSKPRPAPECLQCGTIPCEWRFIMGSCRAFFDEGRFAPGLPPVPTR